jgi:hypothetical protein
LLTNGAVYYDTNANYDNGTLSFCAANMAAGKAIYDAINSAASSAPTCTISAAKDAWCACSVLKTDSTHVFCVDSTGYKKETTSNCTTACPAAGACV